MNSAADSGVSLQLKLSQFKPLQLPGGGLGEFGKKVDPARPLVASDSVRNPFLKFVGQLLAGTEICLHHHIGGRLSQFGLIVPSHHGRFENRGMSDERTLDLVRAEPAAVYFEQVI